LGTWTTLSRPGAALPRAGVACSSSGEVAAVTLQGLNLHGELSATICALPCLAVLDVSFNALSGGVPAGLAACGSLEVLDLSSNFLFGTVPPELGQLNKIRVFDLSLNDLNGTIPPELGNCSNLQTLALNNNYFTGGVPRELGALSSLAKLYIHMNYQLDGTIPPELELGQLSNPTGARQFRRLGPLAKYVYSTPPTPGQNTASTGSNTNK